MHTKSIRRAVAEEARSDGYLSLPLGLRTLESLEAAVTSSMFVRAAR